MSRRLLSEIDKVLRETRASLDLYDERWLELRDFNRTQVGVKEKMWEESRREQLRGKKHAVRTATLELLDFKHVCDSKAKMESDMENTLKRLHRYRQQLTEWLGCTELRTQSDELRDLRKQIELRYKRGRVFYRLGMSSDDCAETDGNADSAVEWISKFIEKLKLQADAWEADVEALSRKLSSEKSKAEKGDLDSLRDRKAQLDAFVDLHKMHIRKLEALLRAIRSRAVTLTEGQGEEIYEALCPYIEDNTDLTVVVADEIYHDVQLPVYYSSDSGESVENLSREESVSPISVSRPVVSLETVVVSKTAPGPERTKSQSDLICSGSPGTLPGERKSAWLSPTGGTDRSPATGGSKAAFPAWNAQGRNSKKTRSEAVAPTTAETGSVVETSTTRRVASPLMQKLPEFPEIVRSTDGVIKEEPSYKSVLDGITKSVAQTGHPNSNPSSPSNMQGKHSIISKPRSQSRTSKKRFRSNPSVLGHSLTHEESSGATPPVCHPIADIDVAVCDWVYEGKGTASDQATMDKTCRVRKGDKLYIVKVDVSGWTFAFIDDPTLVPQPIINAPNGQRQLSPEASKKLMGGWFPDSARAKRAKVLKASVNVPDSGVAGTDSTNNDNNGDANFDRSADTCALAETASLHIEAAGTDSASTKRAANAPPHPKSLLRRLNIIGPNARRKQDSEQASILTETCMGILRLLETTNWTDSIVRGMCLTAIVVVPANIGA
eukprot:Gregarina_sp_Poly_1__8085@NODE_465_length_8170_cov_101_841787_g379_i0_p2_GENE_NODE_465_length_8170_cov_101_841787_g379_i0NODE_465_length_8170_cov_101_841787_g379_i0_p2_ORF_typecomplete_len722_score122_73Not3/PF04065_15/3_3e35CENPF_leu_zip/PF10473_9/1e02CENPF_leu_zip/PF10473_9/0_041OmpH/PF03938_14/1_5e03OmpH/PF03938_14/0_77Sipho_Gp157/PF05565_11/2_2e03Sipho_Gp157/PF05565_11/5_3_NODE_465_length_8170_cov_101_841787_g379_i01562321